MLKVGLLWEAESKHYDYLTEVNFSWAWCFCLSSLFPISRNKNLSQGQWHNEVSRICIHSVVQNLSKINVDLLGPYFVKCDTVPLLILARAKSSFHLSIGERTVLLTLLYLYIISTHIYIHIYM